MYEPHVAQVLARLSPTDRVLDVGGWACPFNRATHVLDREPYDTRGFYRTFGGAPFQGPPEESFSPATWVQRDLCARDPWPWPDGYFDFAICSHTLEDLRDPIGVVRELTRVAKAGYVEVPARQWEHIRGLETRGMVGLSHHWWLIEAAPTAAGGTHLSFVPKSHFIHIDPRYSFPRRHLAQLAPAERVTWAWWDAAHPLTAAEVPILHSQAELAAFVQRVRPRGLVASAWDRGVRDGLVPAVRRVHAGVGRRVARVWSAIRKPEAAR
jgi:hypothetical protein